MSKQQTTEDQPCVLHRKHLHVCRGTPSPLGLFKPINQVNTNLAHTFKRSDGSAILPSREKRFHTLERTRVPNILFYYLVYTSPVMWGYNDIISHAAENAPNKPKGSARTSTLASRHMYTRPSLDLPQHKPSQLRERIYYRTLSHG